MFRIIGFQIRDLAYEKFQFAIYYYMTMGKGLNCSKLGFSVSELDRYICKFMKGSDLVCVPSSQPQCRAPISCSININEMFEFLGSLI